MLKPRLRTAGGDRASCKSYVLRERGIQDWNLHRSVSPFPKLEKLFLSLCSRFGRQLIRLPFS